MPGGNTVIVQADLASNGLIRQSSGAKRMSLERFTKIEGKERLLEKDVKILFISADKTGMVSQVFFRIIVPPFHYNKNIMHLY